MRKSLTAVLAGVVAAAAVGVGMAYAGVASAAAGCRVDYVVGSEWAGGFNAEVTITNLGDPVDGWTLGFTFPAAGQRLAHTWSATWDQSGQQVSATNLPWNATLGTNRSTVIGFVGAWSGSNPAPTTFTLNGRPCTGAILPTPTPTRTTPPPVADWPPQVAFLSPAAGAVYTAPVTIPLAATATVGGGVSITSVSFRVDGVTVAQGVPAGSNRYEAQWTPPTGDPGTSTTYVVSVSAGTSQSLSGSAPPIRITVVTPPTSGGNHPPAVSLSTTSGSSYFLEPTIVTLVADATDADPGDGVDRAELYSGATRIATSATGSGQRYQFQVDLAAATSYTFTVRVYDSHGGIGISNPLNFTVR
ncbi:cellulose binding domain-containing protein [Micromonospora sp. WMMD882]|uniref:cellulose binding domain-containing protein n=1 Tax=Micromonospora sp. WMMD882 TaxID=3015151 RepID=UPI00248B4849|nr:cellulose binding domain-containing protein [Micromonospora sp. WMMD882]WBB78222.1 cellulose binding domain-containing protein [Micromonospora sp. WMMD882]